MKKWICLAVVISMMQCQIHSFKDLDSFVVKKFEGRKKYPDRYVRNCRKKLWQTNSMQKLLFMEQRL